jgi:magnesium transporter
MSTPLPGTAAAFADVADLIVRRFPRAAPHTLAGEARRDLMATAHDAVDGVWVVDAAGRPLGAVSIGAVLTAAAERPLAELLTPLGDCITADADRETLANAALRQPLAAVPVVDPAGRLVGVVPSHALLRVLRAEHVEDMNRLVGIARNHHEAQAALAGSVRRRAAGRLPWLLLGLAGSALVTWLVSRFEGLLARQVAVAFFVPAVVYLADAIGTQTEAIAVRGLSFVRAPLGRLLGGELAAGMLVGLTLAAFALPAVWLALGDARLAIVVALSVFTAGTVASGLGLLLPWLFDHLGHDPADGRGPLCTVVQDLLSVLVYFLIARALLV